MVLVDNPIRSYPASFCFLEHKIHIESLLFSQHAELLNEDKIVKVLTDPQKTDPCIVIVVWHN